jgi:hypothetical protein
MRKGSWKLRWVGCLLLAAASCRSLTQPDLKPPKAKDDYTPIPAGEKRYEVPIVYPDDKKDDAFRPRQQTDPMQQPPSPSGRSTTPGFRPGGS